MTRFASRGGTALPSKSSLRECHQPRPVVAAVADTVLFPARRHIMMVHEVTGQLVSSVSHFDAESLSRYRAAQGSGANENAVHRYCAACG